MNILLLNSCPGLDQSIISTGRCQIRKRPGLDPWPPVDLAQIAAVLQTLAVKTRLKDFATKRSGVDKLVQELCDWHPDVALVHSSTPTLNNDIRFSGSLKSRMPAIKIIFFGLHVTARPEDALGKDIEYVIRGEPEYTARDLLNELMKPAPSIETVSGVSWWKAGRIFHNPGRDFIKNLDELPFPDRSLIDNPSFKLSYNGRPFTIIQVSRGCPFDCSFCTASLYYGKDHRCRSVESILAEIGEVRSSYKINDFLFLSDTFNLKNDFVRSLSQSLIARQPGISWMANSRLDLLDEPTLKLMKKAGCWLISLGVESAAAGILERSGKMTKVDQIETAISAAHDAGIKTLCYFIFGLPGENKDTVNETLGFIRRCKCDYAYFYTATPFPGTGFFREAEEKGWLVSRDWQRYSHGDSDVISYPEISSAEISAAVKEAARIFYLDLRRALKEIASIRSLRQALGVFGAGSQILGELLCGKRR